MLAEGDPKRVIGAYLIDVESSEEGYLAKEDAKAQEEVTAIEPAPVVEAPAVETEDQGPQNMFKADEGRWGSGGVAIRYDIDDYVADQGL